MVQQTAHPEAADWLVGEGFRADPSLPGWFMRPGVRVALATGGHISVYVRSDWQVRLTNAPMPVLAAVILAAMAVTEHLRAANGQCADSGS
jgi:hypothetical protein